MGFKEKLPVFIFGMSVGLLAGCLFFIFKLDSYVRNFNLSLLSQKQIISEQVISQQKENKEAKDIQNHPFKKEQKSESQNNRSHESVISLNDINDSAYLHSDNYQVLKEELVSVKNIYVKTIIADEKQSPADSLAASLAGVHNPDPEEFFMIEFWKTPLNSKGYKMTRSRLLIYGFPEKNDLALIKWNDMYYLRNNHLIYRLNYSSEFRPMERSTEDDIVGKFN